MTNINIWGAAKILTVLFTSVSTVNVFYDTLSRSDTLKSTFKNGDVRNIVIWLSVSIAVGLVDVMFIALVNLLEMPRQEDEAYSRRWSYVFGLVLLLGFIMLIGFMDEGFLAFAPRVVLVVMATVAILGYAIDYQAWRDMTWEERFKKQKYRQEKEDQRDMLETTRQIKNEARKLALKEGKDAYVETYTRQIWRELGYTPDSGMIEEREIQYLPEPTRQVELDDWIFETDAGWGWECPHCGLQQIETAQGNPLKKRGAKIQLSRHVNTCEGA